ncbi:MAG: MarR family transcriptional regulator [Spirosoma sp.]|nr:MarR family transcriptional regulator [Spirosoma sp.]
MIHQFIKSGRANIVLFLIGQISKVAGNYLQTAFDQLQAGITVDQWMLLKIVEENSSLPQTELARKPSRDQASITRTLDLLEWKKLVLREPIQGNRRQHSIVLTTARQEFMQHHIGMVEQHQQLSTDGFSESELNTLKFLLLRIQQNR